MSLVFILAWGLIGIYVSDRLKKKRSPAVACLIAVVVGAIGATIVCVAIRVLVGLVSILI